MPLCHQCVKIKRPAIFFRTVSTVVLSVAMTFGGGCSERSNGRPGSPDPNDNSTENRTTMESAADASFSQDFVAGTDGASFFIYHPDDLKTS